MEKQAKLEVELGEVKVNAQAEIIFKEKQAKAREDSKKFWQSQAETTVEQRNKEKEAQ